MKIVEQYSVVFHNWKVPEDEVNGEEIVEGLAVVFDDGRVVIFLEEGDATEFETLGDVPATFELSPLKPLEHTDPVITIDQAEEQIVKVCSDLSKLLVEKNRKYGNSVLTPSSEIAKIPALVGCVSRIQDKIKRLREGREYPGDDTIMDLAGYLMLLIVGMRLGFKLPREYAKDWGK